MTKSHVNYCQQRLEKASLEKRDDTAVSEERLMGWTGMSSYTVRHEMLLRQPDRYSSFHIQTIYREYQRIFTFIHNCDVCS